MPRSSYLPPNRCKRFFSKKLHVEFDFYRAGSFNALLSFPASRFQIKQETNGIYTATGMKIELVFFLDGFYPYLDAAIVNCFSGEIFPYENNKREFLLLKRFVLSEDLADAAAEIDSTLLFDSPSRDENTEINKIKRQLPSMHSNNSDL